jgi:hypothetical protein
MQNSDAKMIYIFLKEAMLQISPQYPFRGPAKFEKSTFRYENQQYGSLDRFHGIESIYENGEKAYVLYYHGGKIKDVCPFVIQVRGHTVAQAVAGHIKGNFQVGTLNQFFQVPRQVF